MSNLGRVIVCEVFVPLHVSSSLGVRFSSRFVSGVVLVSCQAGIVG